MTSLARRTNPSVPTLFNFTDSFIDDFFKIPSTLMQGTRFLDKDEARIDLSISVYGKDQAEQNAKLADELRKLADKVEAQEPEAPRPPKESEVSYKVHRA